MTNKSEPKTRVFALRISGTKGPVLIADDINDMVAHIEDASDDDWYEIQVRHLTDKELENVGEFDGF